MKKIFLLFFAYMLIYNANFAQNQPLAYWTFDNMSPTIFPLTNNSLIPNTLNSSYNLNYIMGSATSCGNNPPLTQAFIRANEGVSNAFFQEEGIGGLKSQNFPLTVLNNTSTNNGKEEISIEFMAKLNNINGNNEGGGYGSFVIRARPTVNTAPTYTIFSMSRTKIAFFDGVFNLDGLGMKNCDYYQGEYHHFVVTRTFAPNLANKTSLYIDGFLMSEYTYTNGANIYPATQTGNYYFEFSWPGYCQYSFQGGLDEIAVYNKTLAGNEVLSHYNNIPNNHYDFVNVGSTLATSPPAQPTPSIINNNFYAQTGSKTSEYPYDPAKSQYNMFNSTSDSREIYKNSLSQMSYFPLPRYKDNTNLMMNSISWINVINGFMNEVKFVNSTNVSVANAPECANIHRELAKNFRYPTVGGAVSTLAGSISPGTNFQKNVYNLLMNDCANGNGNWETISGMVTNQTATQWNGTGTPRFLSIDNSNVLTLQAAGTTTGNYIGAVGAFINKPMYRIMDNGESVVSNGLVYAINNGSNYLDCGDLSVAANTNVKNDFYTYNGGPYTCPATQTVGDAWDKYIGFQSQKFWNEYFKNAQIASNAICNNCFDANTQKMFYNMFPRSTYYPYYGLNRLGVDPVASNSHYATPQFYPYTPKRWKYTVSNFYGLFTNFQSVREAKNQTGGIDKLFAPYISPGGDCHADKNIRPTQWLALLKAMGVAGAEYFIPFNYSTGTQALWNPCLTNPLYKDANNNNITGDILSNYIWEPVVASYAQAVTSRYEKIMRFGDLLEGDNYDQSGIRLPIWKGNIAGSEQNLIVIKKDATSDIFVLSASSQKEHNYQEDIYTPLAEIRLRDYSGSLNSTVLTDAPRIKIPMTRQGKTFIMDFSRTNFVLYPLDSWHEEGHPIYWKRSFLFEAEMNDNFITNSTNNLPSIVETIDYNGNYIPSNLSSFDLSKMHTYVQQASNNNSGVDGWVYNFQPRKAFDDAQNVTTRQYWVNLQARSIAGSNTVKVNIKNSQNNLVFTEILSISTISGTPILAFPNNTSTQFANLNLGGNYTIEVIPSSGNVQIDKVELWTSNTGPSYRKAQELEQLLQVYPNPTEGKTNFVFDNVQEDAISIEVRDISGRLLDTINQNIEGGKANIEYDLSKLSQGVYFYQVTLNGNQYSGKIVRL